MIEGNNKSIRQKILSFFEVKKTLINRISPIRKPVYIQYLMNISAFLVPIVIIGWDAMWKIYQIGASIFIGVNFLILLINLIYSLKKMEKPGLIKTGTYLDLSIYKERSILVRVLSGFALITIIYFIWSFFSEVKYVFEWEHIFVYLSVASVISVLVSLTFSNKNNIILILKVESNRLRIGSDQGESYVFLSELKEIRIGDEHISFVPIVGQIERLNKLKLSQVQKKNKLKIFSKSI